MLAIATLLIVVLMSLLITKVASVALILTGLSRDVARFQARSALSGTGLGTAEAEQIVNHPARRQIVRTLMLLGNAGLVTTVASLSVSFSSVGSTRAGLFRLGMLIVGLALLLLLARNQTADRYLSRVIERILRRYTHLDVVDYAGLLHLSMDYAVGRVEVDDGHWLAGQTLASSELTAEGALVLGVERADGGYLGAPMGSTTIEPGDIVLVYGDGQCLSQLHGRPAGEAGAAAHLENIRASQARVAAEQSVDRRRGHPGPRSATR